MKTFNEMFADHIDRYLGTVQIDESTFKEIQEDALRSVREIGFSMSLSQAERDAMPEKMKHHLECLRDTNRRLDFVYCLRACLQELHQLKTTPVSKLVDKIIQS